MYLAIFFVCFAFIIIIFGIGFAVDQYDRIIVSLMRRFDIALYPTAIAIAMLILEHPEQWNSDKFHLSHPDIGSIWIANAAYGLHIETAFGDWKPNTIERRIIRDAVDWRIHDFLKGRIRATLQRNALTGR